MLRINNKTWLSNRRFVIFATLFVFILSFSLPVSVSAQTADNEDINRAYEGLVWAPDGLTVACSGNQLIGSNNIETVWNYLTSKGLTEVQAAGVMGNLRHESNFDPTAVNSSSGATGLAQWLGSRQENMIAYAELQGIDPFTLGIQLDFMWFELTGEPAVEGASGGNSNAAAYNDLLSRTNVVESAASFAKYYERYHEANEYDGSIPPEPGEEEAFNFAFNSPEPGSGPRLDYAEEIYSTFSGSSTPDGFSAEDCVSSPIGPVDYSANPDVRVDEGTRCISGPLQPGLSTLRQYILDRWSPEVTSIGNSAVCRDVFQGGSVSVHAEGRAIDVFVDAFDPEALVIGNEIRDWLILNSTNLGMQRVIWNRHVWSANRDGWRDYCGGNCIDQPPIGEGRHPHEDHLHVELNWDGALEQTPFFTQGAGR